MPSATVWMDPDVILLSEVREAEKGKYYVIDRLHLKSKIVMLVNLFTKQK